MALNSRTSRLKFGDKGVLVCAPPAALHHTQPNQVLIDLHTLVARAFAYR